jgi:hypothetical protein
MAITYPALSTVGQNSTTVNYTKGSANALFRIVSSTGTPSDSAVYAMPIIKESTLDDTTAENKLSDEGGTVYISDGDREIKVAFTTMQGDMNAEALPTLLSGQYVQIVKEERREGTPYYTLYGVVKMSKSISNKKPGNDTVLTGNVQVLSSALGVDVSAFTCSIWAGNTMTGTVTVPASAGYIKFNK